MDNITDISTTQSYTSPTTPPTSKWTLSKASDAVYHFFLSIVRYIFSCFTHQNDKGEKKTNPPSTQLHSTTLTTSITKQSIASKYTKKIDKQVMLSFGQMVSSLEELDNILLQASKLLTPKMPLSVQTAVLESIKNIPAENREGVMIVMTASFLSEENQPYWADIITEVNLIPKHARQAAVCFTLFACMVPGKNLHETSTTLAALGKYDAEEITSIIHYVGQIRSSVKFFQEELGIHYLISEMGAIPRDERSSSTTTSIRRILKLQETEQVSCLQGSLVLKAAHEECPF